MEQRILEAGPSKRFFVEMLPRDISLEHAVLDLVDNSVDGAIRTKIDEIRLNAATPYTGLGCDLMISGEEFSIKDNCGGIPKDRLDAALKLGREDGSIDNDKPTIGVYGIGMKRSIFKIAADATVTSNSSSGFAKVDYTEAWMNPDNSDWRLTISEDEVQSGDQGVTIMANKLRPNIATTFSSKAFIDDLMDALSRYYAYIIEKGFSITVNTIRVRALPVEFKSDDVVSPYFYESDTNGVKTTVLVGLFRKLTR